MILRVSHCYRLSPRGKLGTLRHLRGIGWFPGNDSWTGTLSHRARSMDLGINRKCCHLMMASWRNIVGSLFVIGHRHVLGLPRFLYKCNVHPFSIRLATHYRSRVRCAPNLGGSIPRHLIGCSLFALRRESSRTFDWILRKSTKEIDKWLSQVISWWVTLRTRSASH